eukprot:UN23812
MWVPELLEEQEYDVKMPLEEHEYERISYNKICLSEKDIIGFREMYSLHIQRIFIKQLKLLTHVEDKKKTLEYRLKTARRLQPLDKISRHVSFLQNLSTPSVVGCWLSNDSEFEIAK